MIPRSPTGGITALSGALVVVVLLIVAASCSVGGGGGTTSDPGTGVTPAASASDAPRASGLSSDGPASPAVPTFTNPVLDKPLADPFILAVGSTWYAYGTKGFEATDFTTARSTDLVDWEELPTALPDLPSWSTGRTWAPEVADIGDRYVMYFSTNAPDIPNLNGEPTQCSAVATSDDPEGPFVAEGNGPLVCQPELGGSIDATYFRDAQGSSYLIWKNDGNCCGIPTQFFLQALDDDGLALVGKPTDLGLENDLPWEGQVIEAPTMLERDGTYYLFYSGGHFGTQFYSVGYATSSRLTGPFQDAEENPILVTKAPAAGPGHQTIVEDDDGDLWMAYHAWDSKRIGEHLGGARKMWLDELVFEDGRPVVFGPDAGPQPVP